MTPRYVFFGGKGGVGKTTCAAAAAVRAAAEGERVLVVSTDPAHSLADALDASLSARPRPVRGAPRLHAAELDADRALSRWLRGYDAAFRTIAERGTYFDDDDVDRLLSLSLPGVDELVGLVELDRLARSQPFDVVVVDTAPTGHTLRLLEMPDTLARLAEILDDMHEKHRFLASSLGGSWRPDFADAAIGDIAREAASLKTTLRDGERTSFTWVTLPEELPFLESVDAVERIRELGVAVAVVVVNRVWPAPDRPCPHCTPRRSAESRWRQRIAETFRGASVLEIPAAANEPRGPSALAALAASVRATEPTRGDERSAPPPRTRGDVVTLPIPATTRLVLVGGKGGVGKTTVAAAAALELAAARPEERVLVLSTDPAHSLGDALGVPLADEPRSIHGAPPNLVARELDAAAAWEHERQRHKAAINELFSSIFRGRMDAAFDRTVLEDLVDLAPPGIDELFALVGILDALDERKAAKAGFGLVVVDTAPTGHTLRLLALPEKALAWVHALMSVILKYRSVIGLGELASDLTELAQRLRRLIALLADPARTSFLAVARPAELPRRETERLAKALRELHVPLAAIVANAVSEPACTRCTSAAAAEAPELRRLARLGPVLAAPAEYPSPGGRGPAALRAWRVRWRWYAPTPK